jgi:uncharacterized protein (UPF0147 family)
MEEKVKKAIEMLDQISEDNSIPRNIRRGATEAKEKLMDESQPLDVRASSAIFIMDELANDQNLPLHGRTMVWNIMSQLEALFADEINK